MNNNHEYTNINKSDQAKPFELQKVIVKVCRIVNLGGYYYYEVSYADTICHVRLLPFELQMMEQNQEKKELVCIYTGLDVRGIPRLIQDRNQFIDNLYEEDTVQTFNYIESRSDYKMQPAVEYHLVRDNYGLKHRFYGELNEEQKVYGAKLELYIRSINPNRKRLSLSLYNPKINRIEKEWFDADKIFKEINETSNKEHFFDCYFIGSKHKKSNLIMDFINQYQGHSNLWLLTYMNILDNEVVDKCIKKHLIEDLSIVCQIMIKLQKWMIKGSTYLNLFGEETKNDTILKSTYQIQKFQRLLSAIEIVKNGKQDSFVKSIISSIQESERFAICRKERIEVLINTLRIYPEYILQDIEITGDLIQSLLMLGEDVEGFSYEIIIAILDKHVEHNVRLISAGAFSTIDIDASQTILINEILALLAMKVLILKHEMCRDELSCRTAKACFFRFLSFICVDNLQTTMIKAGIDALVGVIDDRNIFTWENATHINPIQLYNLTAKATVLDSNIENDYYYINSKGKSGVVILDAKGFMLLPYKQCITNFRRNIFLLKNVRIIHRLKTLPIKIGSMYNIKELLMKSDAIQQYQLWKSITKSPTDLITDNRFLPEVGDKVRVVVKEQNQPDNLKFMIFVSVIDNRFDSIEGIIMIKDVTSKWVDDARILFEVGDVFYATVCKTENNRYSFSIKEDVSKYSTPISAVKDDVKHILINAGSFEEMNILSKKFIQELILLIDMHISKEKDSTNRLTLIGYAYCLCSLVSDVKSYYYDFMLRYYAIIEKFVSDEHQDVIINFHDTIDSHFPELKNKSRLVKLLSYTNSQSCKNLTALQTLVENEAGNDVGKIAAMLLTYSFAQKSCLSLDYLIDIKNKINKFIGDSEWLNLSFLDIKKKDIEESGGENNNKIAFVETVEIKDSVGMMLRTVQVKETQSIATSMITEPLKLSIFGDNTIIISDGKLMSLGVVTEILMPPFVKDGILLLINNVGGICKVVIQDLINLEHQIKLTAKINPYKLSNHFTIPIDCIIGLLITTEEGEFIEMYQTASIPNSSITQLEYKQANGLNVIRQQPFIIPSNSGIEDIEQYFGYCVERRTIPSEIVSKMQSYGVYI